jgi:rhodanese-related sulfurtransferase
MSPIVSYLLLALVIGVFGYRLIRNRAIRKQLPNVMNTGATIVDVRTPGEFAGGHFPGSTNIPVNELQGSLAKLDRQKPVIVCCASGARSAMAAGLLRKNGFANVTDAGPWQNLNTSQSR